MKRFNPSRLRQVLLALGLGLVLLVVLSSGCLGLAAHHTSFSVHHHWQLALPAPASLLNPGKMIPPEPELTGLLFLNGEGEWVFSSGHRFVLADTVQLGLGRGEPELENRVNELYCTLNPVDNFFLDLGKQVVGTGTGYFLNPAGLWPEQTSIRQDRTLPPEGRVLVRGAYLFPRLTLELGWAPRLVWAEDEDEFLWKYFGSPQKTTRTWAIVSGGLAGFDLNGLLVYGGQWKTGLSLAKVWGDRLETHAELGWEEQEASRAQRINKLFRALLAEETEACPPPLRATTAQGSLKALFGGHYTFAGGENLLVEYFYNGNGLTREE